MFADLHIHSWYSDGRLSPEELVKKAKAQNVSVLSLCDHETIDAYLRHGDFCAAEQIRLIMGAEIISVLDGVEYHVLAYGFDMQDKALTELLRYDRGIFAEKGNQLIEKIAADYPNISMEEFSRYERNRKNGGWKSIDYLKSKGIVKNWPDFAAFVRNYSVSLDSDFLPAAEVISIIHGAGGYAVLAHLGEIAGQDLALCEEMAGQFLDIGIDGFECYYTSHTAEITNFLLEFCREHNLMITAGSDEHGGFNNKPGGCDYSIGAVQVNVEQLNLKGLL